MAETTGPAKSFVFYNNKGGVGKTSLAFNFAVELAERNPNKIVLGIDLDSQCNFSSLVLGGGEWGRSQVVQKQIMGPNGKHVKELFMTWFKTGGNIINNYISYPKGLEEHSPPLPYLRRNDEDFPDVFPSNLQLICGSLDIDSYASVLERKAHAPQEDDNPTPFASTYSCLRDLLTQLDSKYLVVVDTNPSFSIVTKVAITGCDELIIPTTLDEHSIGGMQHLLAQLGYQGLWGELLNDDIAITSFVTDAQDIERDQRRHKRVRSAFYRPLKFARLKLVVLNLVPHDWAEGGPSATRVLLAIEDRIKDMLAKAYLNQNADSSYSFALPHTPPGKHVPSCEGNDIKRLQIAKDIVSTYYMSEISKADSCVPVSQNRGIGITMLNTHNNQIQFDFVRDAAGERTGQECQRVRIDKGQTVRVGLQFQNLVEQAMQSSMHEDFVVKVRSHRNGARKSYRIVLPKTTAEFDAEEYKTSQGEGDELHRGLVKRAADRRGRRLLPFEKARAGLLPDEQHACTFEVVDQAEQQLPTPGKKRHSTSTTDPRSNKRGKK